MAQDALQEPITMTSRLPGDAHSSPSPSPSPEPVAGPSTATHTVQPAAGPARTVILTSVSPVDPSKRRDFEARFYLPSSSTHATATTRFLDLPESYFQPTQVELQQAFAGQVKKREDMTDKPLMTKALREREEAAKNRAKAARWPHVSAILTETRNAVLTKSARPADPHSHPFPRPFATRRRLSLDRQARPPVRVRPPCAARRCAGHSVRSL